MSGASDLAQDIFAGVLGQVQVQQDQVWNCRIRIGPLSADEGQGFASARQVNQFKSEVLPLQGSIEKEDVRAIVFNDEYSRGANNRNVFHSYSALHHSTPDRTSVCADTWRALTTHRLGAGPT